MQEGIVSKEIGKCGSSRETLILYNNKYDG